MSLSPWSSWLSEWLPSSKLLRKGNNIPWGFTFQQQCVKFVWKSLFCWIENFGVIFSFREFLLLNFLLVKIGMLEFDDNIVFFVSLLYFAMYNVKYKVRFIMLNIRIFSIFFLWFFFPEILIIHVLAFLFLMVFISYFNLFYLFPVLCDFWFFFSSTMS